MISGYPTAVGCWIAGVQRLDIYNALRAGYPQPNPDGDPHDLLGLTLFGRLRQAGFSVSSASLVVSHLLDELRAAPRLRTIRVGWTMDDEQLVLIGPPARSRPPGVVVELVFDLVALRRHVEQRELDWSLLESAASEPARETAQ